VGIRAATRALTADTVDDLLARVTLQRARLQRAALTLPPRRVLVLAVERADMPNLLPAARTELERSRHRVDFRSTEAGARGKFENLNLLLQDNPAGGYDWLLAVDDDVALPAGFLDSFLFLAERFGLELAQPAHRHRSHAAWPVTRRHRGTVVRQTAFVEIGPVFAFHAPTFAALLPFPPLRVGWGLDVHWAAVARDRAWPIGIVDATPIRHGLRRIASSYDRSAAVEEARAFLAGREYVPAGEAARTLRAHRRWRR
jgi:hypothetical protein